MNPKVSSTLYYLKIILSSDELQELSGLLQNEFKTEKAVRKKVLPAGFESVEVVKARLMATTFNKSRKAAKRKNLKGQKNLPKLPSPINTRLSG